MEERGIRPTSEEVLVDLLPISFGDEPVIY